VTSRRYAILGGGALGLTVAYELAKRGHSVTVLEREPLPGGLAGGFEIEPGMWLEKFYHHLFRSDGDAIGLIKELGLAHRLVWHTPVTATLRGGVLHQLDSPMSLLRFSPLPLLDRIRMGAALAALKAMPNPRLLEGRTAERWIRRWMGRRGFETVWGPLLTGKFGQAAAEIAMPWFWARVHDRSQALGYLRGGFQQLYDRLADAIRTRHGEVRLGVEVSAVTRTGSEFVVESSDGGDRFDSVISTLATRLTARLVPDLPLVWRERHEWGRALGAHCAILALDRPLTSSYWINVNDPGYPFMAAVEHTNFMAPAEYGGRHLLYLGNYKPMDDPLMTATKEEVLEQFIPHLVGLNPAFERSWVTDAWIFAAPFAQPIVTVDYRDHIPPFETPILGLYIGSMFQVYPHDRGQNYSIQLARQLAEITA
jgi:protoporphyrinogen oxidase